MKSKLEALIRETVETLFGVSEVNFVVEHTELSHGDYAANVALVVAKQTGKNPKEVAEALVANLQINMPNFTSDNNMCSDMSVT